ncbi:MAG: DNA repair protein RadA, partial [Novibacillus thermophilus]
MGKEKTRFVCQACGFVAPKWLGKCPGCGKWNALVEERETPARGARYATGTMARAQPITSLTVTSEVR